MSADAALARPSGNIRGLRRRREGILFRNRPAAQAYNCTFGSAPRGIYGVQSLLADARSGGHLNLTVEPAEAGVTTARQLDVVA